MKKYLTKFNITMSIIFICNIIAGICWYKSANPEDKVDNEMHAFYKAVNVETNDTIIFFAPKQEFFKGDYVSGRHINLLLIIDNGNEIK